jgi:hypothetical protein
MATTLNQVTIVNNTSVALIVKSPDAGEVPHTGGRLTINNYMKQTTSFGGLIITKDNLKEGGTYTINPLGNNTYFSVTDNTGAEVGQMVPA